MKVTVSISYNMKKNLWIFRSHLSAAQHPTLKARPLQWRSSARFPHCRWTQPSNAVDPPARAQCSDPRNHWNHLSSDESVVFFSLGVQNISKIFARINTHGHLWLLTHFTNCRIKLSIEWNQTFQLRSIPIIVFYFFSVFFSIHLSDTDQYITFQYIEYHKPHSSQLLSFCWITNHHEFSSNFHKNLACLSFGRRLHAGPSLEALDLESHWKDQRPNRRVKLSQDHPTTWGQGHWEVVGSWELLRGETS